jgi:outer membrane immunogenic protein
MLTQFRAFAGTALIAITCVFPVAAADLGGRSDYIGSLKDGPVAVKSWDGVYLGAYAGYAWGSTDADINSRCEDIDVDLPPLGIFYSCGGSLNDTRLSKDIETDSFVAGGILGYNVQVGARALIGLEVSGGFAKHDGSASSSIVNTGADTTIGQLDGGAFIISSAEDGGALSTQFERDWDVHLSARAGWLITPSTLFFVKGGLSFTELDATATLSGSDGEGGTARIGFFSASDTLMGAHIGLGFESQLAQSLVFRVEGQATWYESLDVNLDSGAEVLGGDGSYSGSASFEPSDVSVKAGLIYQLR